MFGRLRGRRPFTVALLLFLFALVLILSVFALLIPVKAHADDAEYETLYFGETSRIFKHGEHNISVSEAKDEFPISDLANYLNGEKNKSIEYCSWKKPERGIEKEESFNKWNIYKCVSEMNAKEQPWYYAENGRVKLILFVDTREELEWLLSEGLFQGESQTSNPDIWTMYELWKIETARGKIELLQKYGNKLYRSTPDFLGTYGHLYIPYHDLSVPVNECWTDDKDVQQIVDEYNMAAHFAWWHNEEYIGDHNSHGFWKIMGLPIGTQMFIRQEDGLKEYRLFREEDGYNLGLILTTLDDQQPWEINPDGLTLYTCTGTDGYTIRLTFWEPYVEEFPPVTQLKTMLKDEQFSWFNQYLDIDAL